MRRGAFLSIPEGPLGPEGLFPGLENAFGTAASERASATAGIRGPGPPGPARRAPGRGRRVCGEAAIIQPWGATGRTCFCSSRLGLGPQTLGMNQGGTQ